MSCITKENFKDGLIIDNMHVSLMNKINQTISPIANRGTVSGRVVMPLACAGILITSLALRIIAITEPLLAMIGDIALAIKELDSVHLIRAFIIRPFIQFPMLSLIYQPLKIILDCSYIGSGIVVGLISPKTAHQNLSKSL
ncbi:MAG: hypothetical protein S4CHLAM123_12810 [Chlamydiales bacterium]|nr:hypothetical protein [Chlamydiales bacterium]